MPGKSIIYYKSHHLFQAELHLWDTTPKAPIGLPVEPEGRPPPSGAG